MHYLQFSNSYEALTGLMLSGRQKICLKTLSNFNNKVEEHEFDGKLLSDKETRILEDFLRSDNNLLTEFDKKFIEAIGKHYSG